MDLTQGVSSWIMSWNWDTKFQTLEYLINSHKLHFEICMVSKITILYENLKFVSHMNFICHYHYTQQCKVYRSMSVFNTHCIFLLVSTSKSFSHFFSYFYCLLYPYITPYIISFSFCLSLQRLFIFFDTIWKWSPWVKLVFIT